MENIIILTGGTKDKRIKVAERLNVDFGLAISYDGFCDVENIDLLALEPVEVVNFLAKYNGDKIIFLVRIFLDELVLDPVFASLSNKTDLDVSLASPFGAIASCIMEFAAYRAKKIWVLTDNSCSQYIKALDRNHFQSIKVCKLSDIMYKVARADINLSEYKGEIDKNVQPFGYTFAELKENFSDMDGRQIIVECIFENMALYCMEKPVFSSFEDANKYVDEIVRN